MGNEGNKPEKPRKRPKWGSIKRVTTTTVPD